MNLEKLLEVGLSGWIIFGLSLLVGGSIVVWAVRRRKTVQKNIWAGGDVAGGDIRQTLPPNGDGTRSTIDSKVTSQKNISAGGDVAGGDIEKRTP